MPNVITRTHPARPSRHHPRPALQPLEPRLLLANLPAGFIDEFINTDFSFPTAMDIAPDGRVFIAQQSGEVRIIKNGAALPTPFATVSTTTSGERGLIGIELDLNFSSNGYVYLYYTATSPTTHNRVSRFTANPANTDVSTGSETILLELDNLTSATNHNGGGLHINPLDGYLYIGSGENATASNSQSLSNLLGKILRIGTDGSIPTSNPFYNSATGKNRAIWALGLRNPYTFDIDPLSGKMYINDVGQSSFEEINLGIPGANYGWPSTEGPFNPASFPNFTNPVYSYDRTQGVAIVGGTFYRPASTSLLPLDFAGDYFFADLGTGFIRRLDAATGTVSNFATASAAPVDIDVAPDGSLYYLERGSEQLRRITYSVTQSQNADLLGNNASFSAPHRFTLDYASTFDPAAFQPANAVTVTGPSNFSASATLVAIETNSRQATFQIAAPNGSWSVAKSGRYLIRFNSYTVGDFHFDGDTYFRSRWYTQQNPDIALALESGSLTSAYSHFINFGQREGRSPSIYFNETTYRANNPDVTSAIGVDAFISGYEHFTLYGQHEGRQPNPYFTESYYLANNPDVAAAVSSYFFASGFDHFLRYGAAENRRPSLAFDSLYYLSLHPDVAAAVTANNFESAYEHYLLYGANEGRTAHP